jgi:predicted TPR repeat methyltransferase
MRYDYLFPTAAGSDQVSRRRFAMKRFSPMSRLSINPAILLSPLIEGYIAYDTALNRLHELNPAAALLVELCDGSRTPEEVATLAAPLLPPDSESFVLKWLAQAIEQRVLIENSAGARKSKVRELSAEELSDLANRLCDEGKVQAAYLCQQRAAELQPADAELLRDLGELAHIVGKRQEARQAYEEYLLQRPDDAEIQHLLTSLRDGAAPARVPNECIHQLYQRFSAYYESNMCDELGYEGPIHLRTAIDQALGDRNRLSILDLGCGTGLAGLAVADRASRLVGIDLSPEMIEQARQQGIYDELHVAEVTVWLGEATEHFDMIIACDTLIYFGDLRQVIIPAARRLAANGVIAFSVERADSGTFHLTDNGRFVHHPDHILAAARASNMNVAGQAEAFLRMEYGQRITGIYVTLRPDLPPNSQAEKQRLSADIESSC